MHFLFLKGLRTSIFIHPVLPWHELRMVSEMLFLYEAQRVVLTPHDGLID